MKIPRSVFTLLAATMSVILSAHAQATRTWVSGVGDDANPCSRTAPCKTFAGAISKTATGGEIDNLDTGGYGAVTITKSITIDGGGGQIASVLVAGTDGIDVTAPTGSVVTLRNIQFQGLLGSGLNGINLTGGAVLHVEHCNIMGFSLNGINIVPTGGASTQVFIDDTTSQDNAQNGLNIVGSGGTVHVNVSNSHFSNNQNGVYSSDYSKTEVRNSDATGNTQAGFIAIGNLAAVTLSIADSTTANNGTGVQSGGGASGSAVRVTSVSLFTNPTGFSIGTNGTISSFGNNSNAGSGAPNASIPLQ
jgi:hypothetical protein